MITARMERSSAIESSSDCRASNISSDKAFSFFGEFRVSDATALASERSKMSDIRGSPYMFGVTVPRNEGFGKTQNDAKNEYC